MLTDTQEASACTLARTPVFELGIQIPLLFLGVSELVCNQRMHLLGDIVLLLLAALSLYLEIKSKDAASSREKDDRPDSLQDLGCTPCPSICSPQILQIITPPAPPPERWAGPWPLCPCWPWDWQPPAHSASGLWGLAGCRAAGFRCCSGSPWQRPSRSMAAQATVQA